jgi:hypothetical protein
MKKFPSGFLMRFIIAALLFSSCQKEGQDLPTLESDASAKVSSDGKSNTFYGPQVQLGNGKLRSFYTQTHEGTPLEIGVIMTSKSLYGLPEEMNMSMLEIHQKARSATPFDHIMVDWNPMGHEPDPLYGVPHFDFHFYMIGMGEVTSIMPGPKMEKLPPPGYMPESYFPTPGGVPMMGKHWLDVNAPELNGKPFTKTFIYGSYDGKVIFYEPMITKAILMEGKDCTIPFGVPTLFSPWDKWYPTKYSYKTDSKTGDIRVSLSDFVWRSR